MKGDFSHWKFDPRENFTGVLQQQGRVLLDRDWNEQTRIDSHRAEQTSRDVIGKDCAAVPADEPNGFRITQVVVNTGADGEERVELQVNTGRVWADGIPVVLSGDSDPVLRVADYFTPPVQSPGEVAGDISSGDRDAVILEVSHEALNGFQEPDRLIEAALGGPDTTERVHTRTAFRLYRLGPHEDCHSIIPDLQDDPSKRGRLTVRLQPSINIPGDCPVVAGGGYSGFEHYLYRIEMARMPEGEAPHFKWSQFNGGLVGRGQLQSTPNRITITANHPAIVNSGLNAFYAEIVQWDEERGHREVTMGAEVSLHDGELHINSIRFGAFTASSTRVFFRLWNELRPVSEFDNPASPFELNDGIQLAFPPAAIGNLIANDYWQFTVRAGEITNDEILIDDAPPAGPHYHRVPLAELTWVSPGIPVTAPELEDCRKRFRPLTNQKLCCTYHIGDGVHTFGDFNSLEEAATHLPPQGGELCLMPGIHFCNVTFTDKQNIRIHGCRDRTWLFPKLKEPARPIIHFEGGRNLSIEDVQMVSFLGSCILVEASESGPPREVGIHRSKMIALSNAIRVEEGEDITIKENILHLWDTTKGGAVVSLRAEDLLIEHNRLIVLPDVNIPEIPGGNDDGGGRPTPEDPCATPEDIYDSLTTYPTWIAELWLIAVFGQPEQLYVAQGGLHLRGGSSQVRVRDNRISGGISHGITLGGSLLHDSVAEEDPDEDESPPPPTITITERNNEFILKTVDSDGNALPGIPVSLIDTTDVYLDTTDEDGLLYSKYEAGTFPLSVGSGYDIAKMERISSPRTNVPAYSLTLVPAAVNQATAFIYDIEISQNDISRMGLSGIGFSLILGSEPAPGLEVLTNLLFQFESTEDKIAAGTNAFATLLSPRELVETTNPILGLKITRNTIYENVLAPFGEAMRLFSQRISFGGITLPIVDNLMISNNEIRENGPSAIDPVSGIFVGHGDNIAIIDNEITANGPVLDAQDYLDRRVQGLRSGIFVRFAGAVAMALGSRKPALRIQGNRVDQPAGRALTALAFGPVSCDGNVFNSEFDGKWNFFDQFTGGVLLLNFGGLHRFLSRLGYDRTGEDQIGQDLSTHPTFLKAPAFRSQIAAEVTLPGGETLYNNNQLRLGTSHAAYTGQLIASFDDLGYDANQSSIFSLNLLLANTLLLAPSIRATDSRFTEDIRPESQPLTISLFTLALGNITNQNQGDHCIVAYSPFPKINQQNQVFISKDCGALNETKGLITYAILFAFALNLRKSETPSETEIASELSNASDFAVVTAEKAYGELANARGQQLKIYHREMQLIEQQYGADDARALQLTKMTHSQEETLKSLKVEKEIASIILTERPAKKQAGAVMGPQGRILRTGSGGIKGLTVQLVDAQGREVGPETRTDDNGFYRFSLSEREAEVLEKREEIFVQVRDDQGKAVQKSKDPVGIDQAALTNFTFERVKFSGSESEPRKVVFEKPTAEPTKSPDLETLKGIGKVRADRLRESGVEDVKTFLGKSDTELSKMIETDNPTIVAQARKDAVERTNKRNINRPIRRKRPGITRKTPPRKR